MIFLHLVSIVFSANGMHFNQEKGIKEKNSNNNGIEAQIYWIFIVCKRNKRIESGKRMLNQCESMSIFDQIVAFLLFDRIEHIEHGLSKF